MGSPLVSLVSPELGSLGLSLEKGASQRLPIQSSDYKFEILTQRLDKIKNWEKCFISWNVICNGTILRYAWVFLIKKDVMAFLNAKVAVRPAQTFDEKISDFQARKKNPNLNFWVRIFSGGVGVFHVKGWGPKSSVCPSKPRESNFFWRDIPGFCRDIPEAPEKFEKKMFGFNSRPLDFLSESFCQQWISKLDLSTRYLNLSFSWFSGHTSLFIGFCSGSKCSWEASHPK